MDWTDEAIILAARPHGEGGAIVQLLTREHGRHAGLVRGGSSRSKRASVEVGNRVQATWRARLAEHLGTMTLEATQFHAASLFDHRVRLAAMSAACAVAEGALPEREPHPALFAGMCALLELLEHAPDEIWPAAYIRWELGLLGELGYGLDLSRCAATGASDDLVWVSPRTGRAVSRAAGEPYRDKLLPLPGFLTESGGQAGPAEVADGLALTGHFLAEQVFAPFNRPPPPARDRLVALLCQTGRAESAAEPELEA